jgi:hypothetical protein
MSKWIEHVKAVAQKLGLNYAEALRDPRTKSSYHKMNGTKPKPKAPKKPKERKMDVKSLKYLLKEAKVKLSVNGKPLNKKQLMERVMKHGLLDALKKITGGKINHFKKATRWTGYATDTAKKGLDLAKTGATVAKMFM